MRTLSPAAVSPRHYPQTGQALRAGDLGPEHVETIAKSLLGLPISVSPEQHVWAEGVLVQAAADMDARTLAKVQCHLIKAFPQVNGPSGDTRAQCHQLSVYQVKVLTGDCQGGCQTRGKAVA
jgi:Domain of unknown function (DUF222)